MDVVAGPDEVDYVHDEVTGQRGSWLLVAVTIIDENSFGAVSSLEALIVSAVLVHKTLALKLPAP